MSQRGQSTVSWLRPAQTAVARPSGPPDRRARRAAQRARTGRGHGVGGAAVRRAAHTLLAFGGPGASALASRGCGGASPRPTSGVASPAPEAAATQTLSAVLLQRLVGRPWAQAALWSRPNPPTSVPLSPAAHAGGPERQGQGMLRNSGHRRGRMSFQGAVSRNPHRSGEGGRKAPYPAPNADRSQRGQPTGQLRMSPTPLWNTSCCPIG